MPLDDTGFYNDLRRRAGIATTPAYDKLNPPGIQLTVAPAELTAIIAALEYIQSGKELIPTRQLLDRLKKSAGRASPSYKHNPLDQNNPYYLSASDREAG